MTLYCVFHIPTASYIYCHDFTDNLYPISTFFLLEIGITHTYDSSARLLVRESIYELLTIINKEITSDSLYYENRAINEFDIQELDIKLIPKEYTWRYKSCIGFSA